MGMNYLATRDYVTAARIFDRAVSRAGNFHHPGIAGAVDLYSKGDLRAMQSLLASWPESIDPNGTITLSRYNLKMYERKFQELVEILQRSPAEKSRGETSAPISKEFLLATVYVAMKDQARARESYLIAREKAEKAVQESPEDGPRHALLGLIYAGLRRCDEAKAGSTTRRRFTPGNERHVRRADSRDPGPDPHDGGDLEMRSRFWIDRSKRPPASPFTNCGWTRSGIRSGRSAVPANADKIRGPEIAVKSQNADEESCLRSISIC